jgi:hypothetical protein
MTRSDFYWVFSSPVQYVLLAIGIFLSILLWWFSRKRIDGLFAISWRMYVTAFLTAGWDPYFYAKMDFMLFWTGLLKGPEIPFRPSLSGTLIVITICWLGYMAAFLLVRSVVKRITRLSQLTV